MASMNKVLVVGGAGYIGGAVTDALLAKHVQFTVYDDLLYEDRYLKPVDFIYGDVRDTFLLKKTLEQGYTHVIWLAAVVGAEACDVLPNLTKSVNADAVCWLSENYNGRVIFMSTCSVYGEHDGEVDESGAVNPLSLYAETKLQAEEYLSTNNSLIFRLGTVFGLSDTYSRPRMDLVANSMPVRALTKGVITLYGGEQWRPMIHVKDVANAIIDNFDYPVRGVYNLASVNLQMKTLAVICSEITGCQVNVAAGKDDPRNYRVSTEKAIRDGIFNPNMMFTVEDGILEFTDLVRSGRVKRIENNNYFNDRHMEDLKANGFS
jgi:nucleoside-diphosphate-sugar epimerase